MDSKWSMKARKNPNGALDECACECARSNLTEHRRPLVALVASVPPVSSHAFGPLRQSAVYWLPNDWTPLVIEESMWLLVA